MANDLVSQIMDTLQNYSEEMTETITKEMEKSAKDALKNLKNNPVIPSRTGKYKESFYMKKTMDNVGDKGYVIANKKYQLTHLLERGHATRNGGRTKAFPHWEDAQKIVDQLPNKIKEALSQ